MFTLFSHDLFFNQNNYYSLYAPRWYFLDSDSKCVYSRQMLMGTFFSYMIWWQVPLWICLPCFLLENSYFEILKFNIVFTKTLEDNSFFIVPLQYITCHFEIHYVLPLQFLNWLNLFSEKAKKYTWTFKEVFRILLCPSIKNIIDLALWKDFKRLFEMHFLEVTFLILFYKECKDLR